MCELARSAQPTPIADVVVAMVLASYDMWTRVSENAVACLRLCLCPLRQDHVNQLLAMAVRRCATIFSTMCGGSGRMLAANLGRSAATLALDAICDICANKMDNPTNGFPLLLSASEAPLSGGIIAGMSRKTKYRPNNVAMSTSPVLGNSKDWK